jgi:hypothetical protein
MNTPEYPTAPLYRTPGLLPLVRYRNTGEYGPVPLGKLYLALRDIDQALAEECRAIGADRFVERFAVPITADEYARLEAYRCFYSKRPPSLVP